MKTSHFRERKADVIPLKDKLSLIADLESAKPELQEVAVISINFIMLLYLI